MTRWIIPCLFLAACATAGTSPDASSGDDVLIVPDAEPGAPDAEDCVPATEICDGSDNNCDNVVDEGCACTPNGTTQDCFSAAPGFIGVGACMQGTQTCVDGMWGETCVGEVTPIAEICNNIDDDCDGTPDDGNPGGGACSTGMSGICAAGTQTCSGGTLSACIPNMSPTTETCDGLDNDCNAATPDGAGMAWFGQPCDGGDADACNEGTYQCVGSAQVCSDNTGDTTATQLLLNPGFDSGHVNWVEVPFNASYPLIDNLSGAGITPQSGAYGIWAGGFLSASDRIYQDIAIPAGAGALTLSGYRWVGTEETGGTWDFAYLEIRNTSDTLLSTVATWTNSSTASSWTSFSYGLGSYAGQTIRISLRTTTDSTLNTNFFFDSFALTALVCP